MAHRSHPRSQAAANPGDSRDEGVVFPITNGSRSTTATGKAVFADAARAVDPGLAEDILAERDWRSSYLGYARRLLAASLTTEHPPASLSTAGLESLHRRFEFVRGDQTTRLDEALKLADDGALETVVVDGTGASTSNDFSVPYRGRRLRGDDLHRQLDRWLEAGTAEPSCAEAIRLVMDNPDWLDLSDVTVVILGAGAEMGPLHSLSRWNATVAPVDLDRPEIWARILTTVREGSGRALIPVRAAPPADDDATLADVAGADLITAMPEVASWIDRIDGPLTLGNYVYADGATHVRVSMAVDAITSHVLDTRRDASLAVLATPTDVFAVPDEAVEWSRRQFADQRVPGVIKAATRSLTGGRLFAPNYPSTVTTPDGLRLGIADCLVKQQGPNYALAKRLQRWRAAVARHNGVTTSINVAPPTRTRSVLRNRALAAAYAGANRFGVEVFDPSTSNTLMAAMLVHDLRNPSSAANPATPLEPPQALFWQGANHGGLWRSPFAPRSVLGLAVVLGMVQSGA